LIELTIFTSQLLLVFFKHITVRTVNQGKVMQSAIYTACIQSMWLISSALGINALLNYDWLSVFAYVTGGVIGTILNFKIKIKS